MAERQGLVMVNTGPGKGKTTAALGQALRAAGQGLQVKIIQFIKRGKFYGELKSLDLIPNIEVQSMGLGLIRDDTDLTPHREKAREAWQAARQAVTSGDWGLVVLDEVFIALGRGFVSNDEIVELIRSKPPQVHLLLTGRGCPQEIMELADTVTKMEAVRHHMAEGVEAQKGVEF
jgi:cob(I)alamin adenosyltransferase